MIRYLTLVAALAATTPALAASEARVNIAGLDAKAANQAIVQGARDVCAKDQPGLDFSSCVKSTVRAAKLKVAVTAPKAAVAADRSMITVSLAGKSAETIQADIARAAQKVCGAASLVLADRSACVQATIKAATAKIDRTA